MNLKTVISKDKEIFEASGIIRRKVFAEEQGFSIDVIFDEIDETAFHAVIFDDDKPVAAGRYFLGSNSFHIGRIAVLPEYRGLGIGALIMREIEKSAFSNGAKMLELSAQSRVYEFYTKLGYVRNGDEYTIHGCPHIDMIKNMIPE